MDRKMELEAINLTRKFGNVTALDAVSFRLEPGKITGFVGPNGAGKSTALRILAGRDLPDSDTHRSDMLWEANRIVERSLGVPTATADRASAPQKPSCKRWLIHALTFTAGLLSGGLLAFLLTLWL